MIAELSNGDSFIRHLDPRVKVVVVLFYSVVVALSYRFQVLVGALVLGIFVVGLAQVPAGNFSGG